jgi:hypothetical protein
MPVMSEIERTMIETFQCPGCVCGSNVECEAYKLERDEFFRCASHVAGTLAVPGGRFVLGLPTGFAKVGELDPKLHGASTNIRLWQKGTRPHWDRCNLPVWGIEKDEHLFVRTYMPRLNVACVDVIEDGRLKELCPNAVDVGAFVEEID